MAKDVQLTTDTPEVSQNENKPRFRTQWNGANVHSPQVFRKPSMTVPDQSMTIPEIIAKYTRTGLVPQSFAKRDEGGNAAFEPGFDPLDEYSEVQALAAAQKAAAGSSAAPSQEPSEEPQSPAPGA